MFFTVPKEIDPIEDLAHGLALLPHFPRGVFGGQGLELVEEGVHLFIGMAQPFVNRKRLVFQAVDLDFQAVEFFLQDFGLEVAGPCPGQGQGLVFRPNTVKGLAGDAAGFFFGGLDGFPQVVDVQRHPVHFRGLAVDQVHNLFGQLRGHIGVPLVQNLQVQADTFGKKVGIFPIFGVVFCAQKFDLLFVKQPTLASVLCLPLDFLALVEEKEKEKEKRTQLIDCHAAH